MRDREEVSQSSDGLSETAQKEDGLRRAATPPLGERLYGIPEIREIFGVGAATASKIMRDTGRSIMLHRKLYILESALTEYLHEQEREQNAS